MKKNTHIKLAMLLALGGFIAPFAATAVSAQQDNKALEDRMARIEKMLEALAASQAAQTPAGAPAAAAAPATAPAAAAPAAAPAPAAAAAAPAPAAPAAPVAIAPAAPEYKKGLWLNLYQRKKALEGKPDWTPFGAMVIIKQPMSPAAIAEDAEYKSYANTDLYYMWEGYLRISKSGLHTLVLEATKKGNQVKVTTGVYLENSLLGELKEVHVAGDSSIALNVDATLEPGIYLLQIPLALSMSSGYGYNDRDISITLKLTEPGSRRARILTNSDLLHQD